GVPVAPVVAAGEEHGLYGVVVAVEIMALGVGGHAFAGGELLEIVQPAGDLIALEDAGVIKRRDARRRARKAAPPAAALVGHVGKTAVAVAVVLHVLDRVIDGRLVDR